MFIFMASCLSSGVMAPLSSFTKFGSNFIMYYLYNGCSAIGLSWSHRTLRLWQYVRYFASLNWDIEFLRKYSSDNFFNGAKSFRVEILFNDKEHISMFGIYVMMDISSRSLPQRLRFLIFESLSVLHLLWMRSAVSVLPIYYYSKFEITKSPD